MGEKWSGNLTLQMDEKVDTYSPGAMEVEWRSEKAVHLTFSSMEGRAKVVIRLSPKDCKTLIKKLTDIL